MTTLSNEQIIDAAFDATTHLIHQVAEDRGRHAAQRVAMGILIGLLEVLKEEWGCGNISELLETLSDGYRSEAAHH